MISDSLYYATKQIVHDTSIEIYAATDALLIPHLSSAVSQVVWVETRAMRHPSRSIILLIDRDIK